jgi:hypothetical protein
MAPVVKTVTHAAATTVPVTAPAAVRQSVAITPTALAERVWVSTDPLVSIYPWRGQALSLGVTTTVGVNPGETLYSYTSTPALLSVTIS